MATGGEDGGSECRGREDARSSVEIPQDALKPAWIKRVDSAQDARDHRGLQGIGTVHLSQKA